MYLLDKIVECKSRSDRVEVFHFQDCHIGKRNCCEQAIIKQRQEILRRAKLPNRHILVTMGGDINDVIKPQDIRFDFNEVADWFFQGSADNIRDKLNSIAKYQVERSVEIFDPIREYILGNIEANHDKLIRKRYNVDTHKDFCEGLGICDMTDEAIIRLQFIRRVNKRVAAKSVVKIYIRHGYGSGRTAGAEACKIARMMADGITADCTVCFTGHTHTYHPGRVEPVMYIPDHTKLPSEMLTRYRFGANPGCWLLSHKLGKGSYESAACYPSRALMTVKIVIWPFWHARRYGVEIEQPKVELRQYPIL